MAINRPETALPEKAEKGGLLSKFKGFTERVSQFVGSGIDSIKNKLLSPQIKQALAATTVAIGTVIGGVSAATAQEADVDRSKVIQTHGGGEVEYGLCKKRSKKCVKNKRPCDVVANIKGGGGSTIVQAPTGERFEQGTGYFGLELDLALDNKKDPVNFDLGLGMMVLPAGDAGTAFQPSLRLSAVAFNRNVEVYGAWKPYWTTVDEDSGLEPVNPDALDVFEFGAEFHNMFGPIGGLATLRLGPNPQVELARGRLQRDFGIDNGPGYDFTRVGVGGMIDVTDRFSLRGEVATPVDSMFGGNQFETFITATYSTTANSGSW